MKRKLSESDRGAAVALLSSAPAINLYMLGNIESMGFEEEVCEFWGDFADDGALRGVLNRYMTGWTAFGLPDADWAALGAILDEHPLAAERLQDNPGGVDSFLPFLQRYRAADIHTEEVMILASGALQTVPPQPGSRFGGRRWTTCPAWSISTPTPAICPDLPRRLSVRCGRPGSGWPRKAERTATPNRSSRWR